MPIFYMFPGARSRVFRREVLVSRKGNLPCLKVNKNYKNRRPVINKNMSKIEVKAVIVRNESINISEPWKL